jgi:hypothetical protein
MDNGSAFLFELTIIQIALCCIDTLWNRLVRVAKLRIMYVASGSEIESGRM